jgi:DNA polymerase III epsilon subunit-like protein
MRMNKLVVFDLETGSTDIGTCQVLEIAAMAVDPVSWLPLAESDFHTLVRPDDPAALDAAAMAVNKLDLDELAAAPPAKHAFRQFSAYLRQHGGATTSSFTAPFPGGKNVRGFDLPIVARYMDRFKLPVAFNPKRVFDLEDTLLWWVGQSNQTDDLSMDTARKYFGMAADGGHRAMFDVRQTAWLLCKFGRLHRHFAVRLAEQFETAGNGVNFDDPTTWFK